MSRFTQVGNTFIDVSKVTAYMIKNGTLCIFLPPFPHDFRRYKVESDEGKLLLGALEGRGGPIGIGIGDTVTITSDKPKTKAATISKSKKTFTGDSQAPKPKKEDA